MLPDALPSVGEGQREERPDLSWLTVIESTEDNRGIRQTYEGHLPDADAVSVADAWLHPRDRTRRWSLPQLLEEGVLVRVETALWLHDESRYCLGSGQLGAPGETELLPCPRCQQDSLDAVLRGRAPARTYTRHDWGRTTRMPSGCLAQVCIRCGRARYNRTGTRSGWRYFERIQAGAALSEWDTVGGSARAGRCEPAQERP